MKIFRIVYLMLILIVVGLSVQARDFRSIQPIAQPEATPADAIAVIQMQPVPRFRVEQAIDAIAAAWNGGTLDPLLADSFINKSRLLDTIAEVVPRDAQLSILGIQAVSTLGQYQQNNKVISSVSAVVLSQIEFNDPLTGFQRLEGTGEWYFQVEEETDLPSISEAGMAAMIAELGGNPDAPYIENIFPARPNWDSTLTIQGGNFGESTVLISAYVHDPTSAYRPDSSAGETYMRVLLLVESWTDSLVTARMTQETQNLFESGWPNFALLEMPAVVSISTPEGRAGKEIVFQPTPGLYPPEITEVISGSPPSTSGDPSLSPGGTISLRGEHFSRPGGVVFRLLGASDGSGRPSPAINFEGQIVSWSNSQIEVTLPPSAGGFVAQNGQVVVTNDLGVEGSFESLFFLPRLETQQLENYIRIDSGGIENHAACEQALTFFSGLFLRNGWQATGTYTTSSEIIRPGTFMPLTTTHCSTVVIREPVGGSGNPAIRIRCKAYYHASCSCGVQVQIRGPAGTLPLSIEDQVWLQPPIEDPVCY